MSHFSISMTFKILLLWNHETFSSSQVNNSVFKCYINSSSLVEQKLLAFEKKRKKTFFIYSSPSRYSPTIIHKVSDIQNMSIVQITFLYASLSKIFFLSFNKLRQLITHNSKSDYCVIAHRSSRSYTNPRYLGCYR